MGHLTVGKGKGGQILDIKARGRAALLSVSISSES